MAELTRSQHPDLRLFTQVPGKLAWVSNRSYKTWDGCNSFLNNNVMSWRKSGRREVEYRVHLCPDYKYRVLATSMARKVAK